MVSFKNILQVKYRKQPTAWSNIGAYSQEYCNLNLADSANKFVGKKDSRE